MNMLVDGEWRTDAYESTDDDGSFQRQETAFRDWVRDDPDAEFQPEAGRYHLYVSYACPWAHRTLVSRALNGLEDAIPVSVVDPYRDDDGWQFTPEKEGCTRDHVHDADYLRELYVRADPDATCRVTVPVLWDTHADTIVNNESREIMRMLETVFDEYATRTWTSTRRVSRRGRPDSGRHLRADQQRRLPGRLRNRPGTVRRGRRRPLRGARSLERRPRRPAVSRR